MSEEKNVQTEEIKDQNASTEEGNEELEKAIDENEEISGDSSFSESQSGEELQGLKDKYLRLMAEFENYKKRTFRERLDTINTASRDMMLAILPVLDDFDRAKLAAVDESSDEQFSKGVELVYQKLNNILQSKGLKVMETTGEPFDPEFHEALTEIPASTEDQKGLIIDTIEKGYTLNDKIIRHAKVVVGK